MASEKARKCAHPNCTCATTGEKYCSIECEAMEKTPDVDCRCGHPQCEAKTH